MKGNEEVKKKSRLRREKGGGKRSREWKEDGGGRGINESSGTREGHECEGEKCVGLRVVNTDDFIKPTSFLPIQIH